MRAFALLLAFALAHAAGAATLSGDSAGRFLTENGRPNVTILDVDGAADARLRWGDGDRTTADSRLTLAPMIFDALLDPGANRVAVAGLAWFNGRTYADSTDLRFVATAEIALRIAGAPTAAQALRFTVVSTENPFDDRIVVQGLWDFGLAAPLALGGGVALTGFDVAASGGGRLRRETRADGPRLIWRNPEENLARLDVYALLTFDAPPPVPVWLPAPVWLLAGGLGALCAVGRRRRPLAA